MPELNIEPGVVTDIDEVERKRQDALSQLEATSASARRVLGSEVTRQQVRVSGPDGTVMTNNDLKEDVRVRREHGGRTDVDSDFAR